MQNFYFSARKKQYLENAKKICTFKNMRFILEHFRRNICSHFFIFASAMQFLFFSQPCFSDSHEIEQILLFIKQCISEPNLTCDPIIKNISLRQIDW